MILPDGESLIALQPDFHTVPTSRFERRWRMIGVGLCNVWRFGDLELPAPSGRVLLRGENGAGKTTALEALWPFLLDLNPARLVAGKGRTTSVASLMREGLVGKRRCGYVWLTTSGPEGVWSFGARLQYSEGASPPVKVIPFAVPGRPLHELALHGPGRMSLAPEQFAEAVGAVGGRVFEDDEAYVSYLASHVFGTPESEDVTVLAKRLREVRNPALLAEVSPQAAADALRESLPGVTEDVIAATAEALAESDTTREAFARDKEAAELLEDFRAIWCAHATEVVGHAHSVAASAAREVQELQDQVKDRVDKLDEAWRDAADAKNTVDLLDSSISETTAEIKALEERQAYKDAGRLQELRTSLVAQTRAADAAAQVMLETARTASGEGISLRRDLDHLIEDLTERVNQASAVEPATAPGAPLLSWSDRPRAVLQAGDIAADPGPDLTLHGDSRQLRATAASWLERARTHAARADSAALAITDYKSVEVPERLHTEARKSAGECSTKADTALGQAKRAQATARDAVVSLLGKVSSWTSVHPQLAESSPDRLPDAETEKGMGSHEGWTPGDVDQLVSAEPEQVTVVCDDWARHALFRAEGIAAELRARGRQASTEAARLRQEAEELQGQANDLRAGRLMPLPRPEWAGPGDDSIAMGAALDWADGFRDPREQALLEAALGAAGVLGASVAGASASTSLWSVEATGSAIESNLSDVVAVEPSHPLAAATAAVLKRIQLVASAIGEIAGGSSALVIGRDGTFRAGVLRGRIPGADDPAQLPPAQHVGALRRRAAALVHADELEREAGALIAQAQEQEGNAAQLIGQADTTSTSGSTFPSREELRAAELRRAVMARVATDAQEVAERARLEEERTANELRLARAAWLERTRARGLPGEIAELMVIRDRGAMIAKELRNAAGSIGGKLAERLDGISARQMNKDVAKRLSGAEATARAALQTAEQTQTMLQVLEQTAGAAIKDVLAQHATASDRLNSLQTQLGPARGAQVDAAKAEGAARTALAESEQRLSNLGPKAADLLHDLRRLLSVPGVADATLDGDSPADDAGLLAQVTTKLQGRKTMTRKTMRERADAARAKLAGSWALDPGEDHGDLLTYVLTHRDASYTPTQAAEYARILRRRAEQALADREERALREFVLGRLPSAISAAWIRLHDWVRDVNRKMRSASASSGVGVQVRIPPREDLEPASRVVFELSCKVSDAERTPDQQAELAAALQALLGAATGETMQERVASAVDVREWVEVQYEVNRAGGKTQRWNSKTGLSSGERRLVVLAPMLAAIAAALDRFGEKALRLVPLDEIPAEVDERGREGLARYIAQLDLDLICTSHLWDGCPGAWDLDAHDMEAGPDGTVVAFPMLLRGLIPIPGDPDAAGSSATGKVVGVPE